MKKFFSKKILVSLVTVSAVAVVLWIVPQAITTSAGPNDNVTGWAYSDMPNGSDQNQTTTNPYGGQGLGWISLNDINPDSGGGSYGVNLGNDGAFTGRGWSEYGGWVDFNPGGNGPDGTPAGARVADVTCLTNNTQCSIIGWIRFTAPASGSWNYGGWDGWVSMSGAIGRGGSYGVKLSAPDTSGVRNFSGQAWGDRVVGWVDFQWAKVKIPIVPPQCSQGLVENPNNLGQNPPDCVCPNTFLPPVNGSCDTPPPTCPTPAPNPNYPGMTGYNALCPCQARPNSPQDCSPIKGCLFQNDPNYNQNATIEDTSMCFCPKGDYNPTTDSCPTDICRDKIDNDKDGLIDAKDPSECPVKGPKNPVFIET